MALTFNLLLRSFDLDPATVRLLRHETRERARTPYAVWRDDRPVFERWQCIQLSQRRSYFAGSHWASFVVTPDGRTLFVGIYRIGSPAPPAVGAIDPFTGGLLDPEWIDVYPAHLCDEGRQYVGRLAIDWGGATRSWVQRAVNQDKPIIELARGVIDPPFPGTAAFTAQLSEIASLPPSWRAVLSATRGVYLLTCPRTREQYVGSATGAEGLLGRWLDYLDGHGGNVGLRYREQADYRISILQVAGSADDRDAVLAMEVIWKAKLQSREMGLNRN